MTMGDWVRICPKCHSKEVTQRGMVSRRAYDQSYVCQSCGFQGPLFPEVKREDAKRLPDRPRAIVPSQMPIWPVEHQERKRLSTVQKAAVVTATILLLWLLL